jgi:RNA polymerase sigma factor (sigma-70 family)
MYLYILFFLFFTGTSLCANLSKIAQKRIKYIIQHPGTTYEMREKINYILFNSYKNWATTKAIHFKRLHKHKCSHIKTDEMISYSLFGLYQGIKRYNGNNTFITYVDFYIKNELQQCLIKLFPINALPKTYLKKKKTQQEYKKMNNIYLKPIYIGFDHYFLENTIYNSIYSNKNKWFETEEDNNLKIKLWNKIRELPSLQMRIMYFKYSTDFEMLRSNKEIAEIMGCSQQTIRINLIYIKNKLFPFIIDNDNIVTTKNSVLH